MKRNPPKRPLWMLSLVIALLALLPLLAALQYRWLGQVSEGEREMKKNTLTTMSRQFCQEFDSELTAIHLFLNPAPNPFGGDTNQTMGDFAARYRRWRETSPHPKMVREIYQTLTGESEWRLARFNAETGALEPCEWPGSMSKLRKRLEENRATRESLGVMLRESFERKTKIGSEGERKTKIGSEGGAQKMVFHFNLGMVDIDLPGLIIAVNDNVEEGA